jgi:hypothetical protein
MVLHVHDTLTEKGSVDVDCREGNIDAVEKGCYKLSIRRSRLSYSMQLTISIHGFQQAVSCACNVDMFMEAHQRQ